MMFVKHFGIRYPRSSQPVSLTPRQVATTYGFPLQASGAGYVGGIIELGGGYDPVQIGQYFSSNNLPSPSFVDVPIGVGRNLPGDPGGADGEVQLDMIVAGAVAPGATFRMYFCGNTDDDFLAGLKQAVTECDGVSISWGASENEWSPNMMAQFEGVIKMGRAQGVPVFVAAGDTGADDSSGAGRQVDFPASAPSAIGCGGTRLKLNYDGSRASETVWDDNPNSSATGGGISRQFPGRQVPDIAGNADPDTGYQVMVDGQPAVIGGTSAVAPLMLGLHLILRESYGKTYDFGNLIATNPTACFDVTQGNNGGYRAGPGRDDVTGWGVPDGAKLLAALTSGIAPPAPPNPNPPTPPVTPPIAPTPPTMQTINGTFAGTITGSFTQESI